MAWLPHGSSTHRPALGAPTLRRLTTRLSSPSASALGRPVSGPGGSRQTQRCGRDPGLPEGRAPPAHPGCGLLPHSPPCLLCGRFYSSFSLCREGCPCREAPGETSAARHPNPLKQQLLGVTPASRPNQAPRAHCALADRPPAAGASAAVTRTPWDMILTAWGDLPGPSRATDPAQHPAPICPAQGLPGAG